MSEAELVRRVKVIVEQLGVKAPEQIPYCSARILWQINKRYIKGSERETLRHALNDNIRKGDRISHIHYSLQRLEANICAVYGTFCVMDSGDCQGRYGVAYEITVLLHNGLAERIMLHGNRDEPVFWLIKSDEDHIYTLRESEVVYIESSHNDLIWHCKDGDVKARGTLKSVEIFMPEHFFRLHRGYIVNANHIRVMKQREVVMDNNDVLLIPFRNCRNMKRLLQGYLADSSRKTTQRRRETYADSGEHIDKKSLL